MVQGRPTSDTYDTHHARIVAEKPNHVLRSIVPESREDAQSWLGACNRFDAPTSVKEHFATQAGKLA